MDQIIQPRNDYVLVQRLEEPQKGRIIVPDVAKEKGIKGKVLATGPGKWVPGEWWKVRKQIGLAAAKFDIQGPAQGHPPTPIYAYEWEWFPGHLQPMEVKPGMTVFFNSKWNDFGADHYTMEAQMEARHRIERNRLHLIQEADIFARVDG